MSKNVRRSEIQCKYICQKFSLCEVLEIIPHDAIFGSFIFQIVLGNIIAIKLELHLIIQGSVIGQINDNVSIPSRRPTSFSILKSLYIFLIFLFAVFN